MSGEVICRCSGSGQDEPARLGATVAGAPHGPPDGRNALPFIDESWCRSFKHSGGVGLGQDVCGLILLEKRLAPSVLSG